jgi:hypothetical protein
MKLKINTNAEQHRNSMKLQSSQREMIAIVNKSDNSKMIFGRNSCNLTKNMKKQGVENRLSLNYKQIKKFFLRKLNKINKNILIRKRLYKK